jgi:hypothetical protein
MESMKKEDSRLTAPSPGMPSMRSLRTEEGRVEICWGGGWPALCGVPLVVAGCIVAFYFAQIGGPMAILGILVCMAPVLGGGWIWLGRRGLEIDADSRTYRQWYGLLTLTKETIGSLDEFEEVAVDREVRTSSGRGREQTCTVYPIRLVGPAKRLDIEECWDRTLARDEAKEVAKALGLALADRTGSEEIVREAIHLDESLRQRRRRTGESPAEIPELPEGAKTEFRREGDEIVLEIPAAGFIPEALRYLWPGVVFPAIMYLCILCLILPNFANDLTDYSVLGFFSLFLLTGMGLGLGAFLRAVFGRCTLRVSPDRLQLTTRGLLFRQVSEIPADELQEMHIMRLGEHECPPGMTQIVARSGRTTAKFGAHLSPEEKEWIKTVLEHVLTT